MAIGMQVGIFKVLGVFGMIMVLALWIGGAGIGTIKGVREGNYRVALSESGGRIFTVDKTLGEEADFLLNPDNNNTYENVFHVVYGLTMLFLLFFVAFILFKIFSWSAGLKAFSPMTDILFIILIVLILLGAQFLYTYFVLGESQVPLSGTWKFVKNMPGILNRITIAT